MIGEAEKLLLKIARVFDNLGIEYFVTGGFAVSIWGRPRATFDIDVIVQIIEPNVPRLAKALREISKAGYIDEGAAKEAVRKQSEFNFIDPTSGLKVDFWIMRDDEFALLQNNRKILKQIENQKVYFISPEDLLLNKLRWYAQTQSDKQQEDIESILKISGRNLDMKYIKKWAEKLEIDRILFKIKSFK